MMNNLKSKGIKKLLIVICIALVIGIAGFYYYSSHTQDQKEYDRLISEAKSALEQGDFDLSIKTYKEAIEAYPKKMRIYIELSDVYVIQEDYGDAYMILEDYLPYANNDEKEEINFLTEQYHDLAIKQVLHFYADYLSAGNYIGEDYYNYASFNDYNTFGLIYLDNDDLPELVLRTTNENSKNLYVLRKYQDYSLITLLAGESIGKYALKYMEKDNLFYSKSDSSEEIFYQMINFNDNSRCIIKDYTHIDLDKDVLGMVNDKGYDDESNYSKAINNTAYYYYNDGNITLSDSYQSQMKDVIFYEINEENIQALYMDDGQEFIS